MFSALGNIRSILVGASVAFTIGFGAGWITKDAFHDAAVTQSLRQSIDKMAERESAMADSIAVQNLNSLRSADRLALATREIEQTSRSLNNEIDQVSEVASGLEYSSGYIRLLNDAIRDTTGSDGVSGASGTPSYSDPSPSGVTAPELLRWQLETIRDYKTAYQQCSALIQWGRDQIEGQTPTE